MIPDAIIVLSAGSVAEKDPQTGETRYRPTTYDESDAFGTLGGRDRVEAAALLAKQYPDAHIITTSRNFTSDLPTLARIYADELASAGVARGRIMEETESMTTETAVLQAVRLAQEKGLGHLFFLSSEFQLPRIRAFYERTKSDAAAEFVSSESILIEHDPACATRFAEIKKTPAYQTRLASEARGLSALKEGTYRSAPAEDKRER